MKILFGFLGYVFGCLAVALLASSPILVYKYDHGAFDSAPWAHLDWRGPLFGLPHVRLNLPLSLEGRLQAAQAELVRYRLAEAAAQQRAQRVDALNATASMQVATLEKAAQAAISAQHRTLIKEILVHVPAAVDSDYPLSVGWVRAHDAAALGVDMSQVANAAPGADDSRSGIHPSTAATVIANNYAACRADAAELTAWQTWWAQVKDNQAAK